MATEMEHVYGNLLISRENTDIRLYHTRIVSLMERATAVARKFLQQRSGYAFEMPNVSFENATTFQQNTMSDCHGFERPHWEGMAVIAPVLPGLTKYSDQAGGMVCFALCLPPFCPKLTM